MKNIVVLIAVLVSFSFGKSIYKKVDDATNSGVTVGSAIPEENRPDGFIIKHPKDEVVFNKSGKVLDEDGNIKLIRVNVKFDFDSYDLKSEYKNDISKAVKFLKKHKTLIATIEGHTDSKGTHEYNYNLSQLRAKKVALSLVHRGISKDRLITKGFGETVPLASNENKEGRAQNRRVDISFNK